ncbi:neuronatin isoform X2 [Bos indicus]|uniref:Neuronatin n=19 Tax=Boreoeutheria TaxID=1437010 RepID=A0A8D1WQT9_PIG|nr:neuronatin isoform beta [Bos taurus]XP_004272876.1 neuronatin isoform X3 [Orcinus orca]XP_005896061.1 PREDICTED: neuronatin isoform X3 [Bos mutus]XP_006051797.1 neuronatin isoform X2 [Bubalus bubalis]XP_007104193.1 neuronatin isoform X2 [Physeter catodon]XP_007193208.1 neuronatin isoform X2 [Balaenoptera acutorostrata]XP_007447784.1 PREDICTED: neuronatin isoform X2 [Lipotes vexillifer]XP_012514409.1 PREDICTED: neuronatin isoform X2 [Propithecus coquereli]XP_012610492.1 neuronatin isoform|eukprot:XP_007104193.1 neuronatin isoform X2 [Physeter catodon]
MAAVAAASAELLIIGWYIFRVLLQVFRYSLQKLAYTVSRTGRHVLGERRQRAPN